MDIQSWNQYWAYCSPDNLVQIYWDRENKRAKVVLLNRITKDDFPSVKEAFEWVLSQNLPELRHLFVENKRK